MEERPAGVEQSRVESSCCQQKTETGLKVTVSKVPVADNVILKRIIVESSCTVGGRHWIQYLI